MRVLIVGAGRLGRTLAHDLLEADHDIRMLDADAERIARLPDALAGRAVHGSGLERETLVRSVAGCDCVATTTGNDALNVVVALAARRELGIPVAVAVVGSPGRAEALTGLGAQIVCPTTRAAHELVMSLVRSDVESELQLGPEVGVYRAELPARLAGRTLADVARSGTLLPVALERGGRVQLAEPALSIEPGDVLHAAAAHRDVNSDLSHP